MLLKRYGFYPAGGGEVVAEIEPLENGLQRLELVEDVGEVGISLRVITAFLANHIADREIHAFEDAVYPLEVTAEVAKTRDAECPGNMVVAEVMLETHVEVFSEAAQKGQRPEHIAEDCAWKVCRFLDAGAPVGRHLSDQLLLPMALGEGGRLRTSELSEHTRTQMWLIPQFVDVQFTLEEFNHKTMEIAVTPI